MLALFGFIGFLWFAGNFFSSRKKESGKPLVHLVIALVFFIMFVIGIQTAEEKYEIPPAGQGSGPPGSPSEGSGPQEGMPPSQDPQEQTLQKEAETLIVTISSSKTLPPGKDYIHTLSAHDRVGGGKIIEAVLNTSEYTVERTQLLAEAAEIFKGLFTLAEVEEVELSWQYPLQDAEGRVSDEVILIVGLTKAAAEEIAWDEITPESLREAAAKYFEHMIFRD